mmetsp:Transcript_14804/g.23143  ORF Transcript_14804/g.23143 Transcript_14804/m.23143 type:complete len:210 (-) Transcript_14804:15-644(-)
MELGSMSQEKDLISTQTIIPRLCGWINLSHKLIPNNRGDDSNSNIQDFHHCNESNMVSPSPRFRHFVTILFPIFVNKIFQITTFFIPWVPFRILSQPSHSLFSQSLVSRLTQKVVGELSSNSMELTISISCHINLLETKKVQSLRQPLFVDLLALLLGSCFNLRDEEVIVQKSIHTAAWPTKQPNTTPTHSKRRSRELSTNSWVLGQDW